MKTEEKAKKYDEALEWMRKVYPTLTSAAKEDAEHYFPELKESEDERIRKWLIDTIKAVPNDSIEWDVIDKSCVLAYLEKQKEPDGIWTEEDDVKVRAMCKEGDLKLSEIVWLKELKNRIVKKEQKPVEWSEEDERIRKDILAFIRREGQHIDKYKWHKWIAWLEKQKDAFGNRAQNITANMLEDRIEGIQRELIEFLSNTINASWADIIKSADCYAQRIRSMLEKQKEPKPVECTHDSALQKIKRTITDCQKLSEHYKDTEENFYHYYGGKAEGLQLALTFLGNENEQPQKEQGPVEWSEEDKRNYEYLHQVICNYINNPQIEYKEREKASKELIPFWERLKSLSPQSKVEWSEEDEEMFDEALTGILLAKNRMNDTGCIGLAERFENAYKWLESFRPRPHWKPSEEQMTALKCAIEDIAKFSKRGGRQVEFENEPYYMVLHSLYEQLKKLM